MKKQEIEERPYLSIDLFQVQEQEWQEYNKKEEERKKKEEKENTVIIIDIF